MALARRGTRHITVEGAAYRWVVAPNDGYMALVAESADGPGQRLEAHFRYHDLYEPAEAGSSRLVGQRRSIGPGVVRALIQAALARGWEPSRRNPAPFRVYDADLLVPLDDPEG
jgi:hypothetical protein